MSGRRPAYRFEDWRPGDQLAFVSDIRKAGARLDWRPSVAVSDGIARLWQWIGQNASQIGGLVAAGTRTS